MLIGDSRSANLEAPQTAILHQFPREVPDRPFEYRTGAGQIHGLLVPALLVQRIHTLFDLVGIVGS